MSVTNENILLKAVTLGDYGVGKTSICNLLKNKSFKINTKQTLGINFESTKFQINNDILKMYIWDTSGHSRFERVVNLYIKNTKLFLLVFNLSNIKTFNILKTKINLINEYNKDPNVLLIGNLFEKKNIDQKLIDDFIKKYNLKYIEIDCKKNNRYELINVICSFDDIKKLKKTKDRSFCKFCNFLF